MLEEAKRTLGCNTNNGIDMCMCVCLDACVSERELHAGCPAVSMHPLVDAVKRSIHSPSVYVGKGSAL